MNKKICLVLSTIGVILSFPLLEGNIYESIGYIIGYYGVYTLFGLAFFALATSRIQASPERTHKLAAFFRITFGASCITVGVPGIAYIIYTWVKADDGKLIRGVEFDGMQGAAMMILTLSNFIQLILYTSEVVGFLFLANIGIAIYAAIKSENERIDR